jgi:DeoR/GlpR family transcriptional regulator of sugar metabolism
MASASTLLPDERRRLIAQRLREHGSVAVAELEAQFRISAMTARRDLIMLERQGVARRTHGGAVLPGLSSDEDSFYQRLNAAVDAKERLAAAAVAEVIPGEAVFVDSSTTGYFAARRIVHQNVRCTLLTNSVPIMELVCETEASQVEVIGVGGMMRKLTRSFVGPQAVRAEGLPEGPPGPGPQRAGQLPAHARGPGRLRRRHDRPRRALHAVRRQLVARPARASVLRPG